MNRREYLKTITEQIRCEKAREGIAKELNGHIEDQKETFLKEGMTETEAEEAAVREMGDPVAAGVELDRIHRPKMPWGLIALIGILHAAGFFLRHLLDARIEGVVFVSSGGSGILGEIVFLLAGLALMIGVCYLDYSRIGRYAKGIWWGAFVVLFPGVWFFGPVINGASWGAYGIVFNLQLVLFLALPLYGAILFQSRGGGYRTVAGNLFLISLPVLLCLGIPSAGNAIFLGGLLVVLMCLALWKGWYRVNRAGTFLAILGIFVGLPALLAVLWWKGAFGLPPLYQIERLRAIFRPSVYAPENSQTEATLSELLGVNMGTDDVCEDFVLTFDEENDTLTIDYVLNDGIYYTDSTQTTVELGYYAVSLTISDVGTTVIDPAILALVAE